VNLALLIGCSEYEDSQIQSLKYPDQDAQTLASVLAASSSVKASDLFVLTSSGLGHTRSTRNSIFRSLSQPGRLSRIPQVDLLFFFFSGHGCRSQVTGQDYLLPSDVVFESFEETAVPLEAVIRYLQQWRARQIVLFVDACRSHFRTGKAAESSGEELIRTQDVKFPGLATFWACSPGQRSFELDAVGAGVFTHALKDAPGDEGRCRSISELDAFLMRNVPELCSQHGLREQVPFSHVEPLSSQRVMIVSQRTRERWDSVLPSGTEIRSSAVRAPDTLLHSGPIYCGFDFGTSYSAVAICDAKGNPWFIPSPQSRILIPSVVAFLPSMDYVVGWPAVEYARTDRDAAVFHIKRRLGTDSLVTIRGKQFSPEFLASLIIRSLARNVEDHLGSPIYRAIVSAPANFSMLQCRSLEKAFELANVPVFRFVSEPSAAGLAAEFQSPEERDWVVYAIIDLGGGTLDVAVVELEEGLWEVKALTGDKELGGLDYDWAVQRYVESKIRELIRSPQYEFKESDLAQIRFECERAKIALGNAEETTVILQNFECTNGFYDVSITITRRLFRALVADLNERVKDSINLALQRARHWEFEKTTVQRVFLAGQGAKIFCVREILEERFVGIPIEDSKQETAVAFGIGRYSGVLTGQVKDRLLLEAMPFGLGVRYARWIPEAERTSRAEAEISGMNSRNTLLDLILDSHTTIPTRKTTYFRIHAEAGTSIPIDLVEQDVTGRIETAIASIDVQIGDGMREIICTIDIDANRTIGLILENLSAGDAKYYQLSNFFTDPTGAGAAEVVKLK
jgi:molecular chaperone DnaK (HSP70)